MVIPALKRTKFKLCIISYTFLIFIFFLSGTTFAVPFAIVCHDRAGKPVVGETKGCVEIHTAEHINGKFLHERMLDKLATKEEIKELVTKEEIKELATTEEMELRAIKAEFPTSVPREVCMKHFNFNETEMTAMENLQDKSLIRLFKNQCKILEFLTTSNFSIKLPQVP